ncbi:leucyl/phenylalanyl-tRNA--protein transferase [Aeromicrobium marinum]|uniref:leucyl/phenylalanyl-tRNA--protein transferase n=1 Tax=Aeromicrobium marinum TaxID=219314 RepID=UPI00031FDB3E|nr:leucyl/phenylalanyl-tRNA--protein transferase [Aeromicrobium marinum]
MWDFDASRWPDDDCVAVGADLAPSTIVAAYRAGAFPMPDGRDLLWWSPMRRGILRPDDVHESRSLRRSMRRFTTTVDTAFTEVIDACADPSRPGAWIDRRVRDAYVRLHSLGWAHSIEVRDADDGALVGGLYGLSVGRLFAGESMFHRRTDASKAAMVHLAEVVGDGLVDVQWSTPHLASMGVVEIGRADYLDLLPSLVDDPGPTAWA